MKLKFKRKIILTKKVNFLNLSFIFQIKENKHLRY